MRELDESPTSAPYIHGMAEADVFLSYSRADTEAMRRLVARLKDAGLATFLDRDCLPAGQAWLPALEQGIARCGAVAVLVGPAGLGTWQRREVQLALDRQAAMERQGRTLPVIPVLLPKVIDPPGGFLRLQTWVDLSQDPDDPDQLQLLLAGIRGQPVDGAGIRETICPYRGLLAFREEDAGLFFGREDAVTELVTKIKEQPFLALIGRSGSGKSSVVYAGLVPALRRREDHRSWAVVALRPGMQPLHAMVSAFYTPPANLAPFEIDQKIKDQVGILRRDDTSLADRVRNVINNQAEKGTDRLLLYVDQWEELYTQALHSTAVSVDQAVEDVRIFINHLLNAARTSQCTVVMTVRADFYGDLLGHEALAAALPPGLVNLGPMSRSDLQRAIGEPARTVGLTVDGPLIETMLDDVGQDLAKLPLLEYALKETWQRRRGKRLTLDAYGEAGGIDGAVAKRANDIFDQLSEAEQAAARRLFVSLVAPGEGREDTRSRVAYPDDETIRAVVRAFSGADARLLVTGNEAIANPDAAVGHRLVEISHESLIREWRYLKDWTANNRNILLRREHVRGRMRQWEENRHDRSLLLQPGLSLEEGRKLLAEPGDVLIDDVKPYIELSLWHDRHMQRRRYGGVAAIISLLLAISLIAGWQWLNARAQRDEAQRNLHFAMRAASGLVYDLAQGFRNVQGVSTDTIYKILSRADKLLVDITAENKPSIELLRIRWTALIEFGATYAAKGDLVKALTVYIEAKAIAEQIVYSKSSNMEWQRKLAINWRKMGDIRYAQGNLGDAASYYQKAYDIIASIVASESGFDSGRSEMAAVWGKIGDIRRSQGDLEGAKDAYISRHNIIEQLVRAAPGDSSLKYDLQSNWGRLGDVRRSQGDTRGALDAYRQRHTIMMELSASNRANLSWQRELASSWNKLGDLRWDQGDLNGALEAYNNRHSVTEMLAGSDKGNAEWQQDLSLSWSKLGDLHAAMGNRSDALAAYLKCRDIIERLAASDLSNAGWQRNLAWSLSKLGDIRTALGELAEADEAYGKRVTIAEQLATTEPGNAEWQRDLALSLAKLGDGRLAMGDLAGADNAHTRRHEITARLAATAPSNAALQRDLASSWSRLGDMRVAKNDLPGALAAYRQRLALTERLAVADGGNMELQQDVSSSWGRLGDVMSAQGDLIEANRAYWQMHAIAARLAALDPANVEWMRDLIASDMKLGDNANARGRSAVARAQYQTALALARDLVGAGRLAAADSRLIEELEQRIAQLAAP